MSETRSRMSSGPSRFMGGALIAANRTAPSLLTLSFSKTRESFWLLTSIGLDISFVLLDRTLPKKQFLPSPRSGRMKVAQHVSAGIPTRPLGSPRSGRLKFSVVGSAVRFTDFVHCHALSHR